MKEPLDTKLSSRIKEVFDGFEDSGADEGWKQLRTKFPEKNHRPLLLWMSSAAAVFIMAAGLWFFNQRVGNDALKPVKNNISVRNNSKKPGGRTGTEHPVNSKDGALQMAGPEKTRPAAETKAGMTVDDPPSSMVSDLPARAVKTEKIGMDSKNLAILLPVEKDSLIVSKPVPLILKNKEVFPGLIPETKRLADVSTFATIAGKKKPVVLTGDSNAVAIIAKQPSVVIKRQDIFSATGVEEVKKSDPKKNEDRAITEDKSKLIKTGESLNKVTFGVFAGSFFNYSEGSENQLNFGAGFSSDIRLGKNLKISTGLSIASNSLDFSGKETQNLSETATASLNTASGGSSPVNASILTTITGYHATLLALDIPVNLKFQLRPDSDQFYLIAGFSSGTYLNETYDYRYRRFNALQGNYVSQDQDQKIKKQFNDFDLAQTLNFSAGISTGFGRKQSISIEPFLKYPLGGLGSQNLRFGSTGINLKLRFTPLQK